MGRDVIPGMIDGPLIAGDVSEGRAVPGVAVDQTAALLSASRFRIGLTTSANAFAVSVSAYF